MSSIQKLTVLALLALASTALAYGVDGMAHSNKTAAAPPVKTPHTSYMRHPEHAGLMYAHIGLMSAAWILVLPVAVMFSIARSRWTQLLQIAFLALNGVGLIVGTAYNAATPDLYPGNAHHGFGWIVTVIAGVHVTVGFLGRLVGALSSSSKDQADGSRETQAFIPTKHERQSGEWQYHGVGAHRMSHDSGHGTELASAASGRSSTGSPISPLSADMPIHHFEDEDLEPAQFSRPSNRRGNLAAVRDAAFKVPRRIWRILSFGYNVVDRAILLLGFAALCTGIATFGRLFEGHGIFSGLAHWIKGGVFFWFGIVSLGRWSGSFGDLGWAWNTRPKSSRWRPTSEFVESATIFTYGITNIFLEHLGTTDNVWSPKDLEHASIAALFIGGGLFGMIVESTRMRHFLNTTVEESIDPTEYGYNQRSQEEAVAELQPPETYEFSLNPIPALVVLLVGKMMSSHSQDDMMDAMIHQQWGDLLFAASLARMATYVVMYLKPPKSVLPSRPPTELLTAFCLMSGGLIFMESAGDVVSSMKHYGMDVMFTYTVTMGVVGLLMAWIMIVLVLKGWASRRETAAMSRSRPM